MNKPFSVLFEDFKNELIELINKSNIPLCVTELVLKDIVKDVHSLAAQQYKNDLQTFKNNCDEEGDKA